MGFLDQYKLIGDRPRTFNINSFEQVGIMDPFCFERHKQREDEPEAFQLPENPS